MKTPFARLSGRIGRVGGKMTPAVLFSASLILMAGFLSAQEGRTVISMSPEGTGSLSWTRPSTEIAPVSLGDATEMTLPESSAPVEKTASPIKPVRLLQFSESETEPEAEPINGPQMLAVSASSSDLGHVTAPVQSRPSVDADARKAKGLRDDVFTDECPDPKSLSSILELSYKVTPQPGLFPESCPLPDEVYTREAPTPITYTWKASALCHKPLYFEDVQLERYGHTICPLLQPALSGARFWLTIPILPYLMGVNPPNECIYDLGYYRPGSCAPHMLEPLPISLRGGLMQAGATVGFFYIFP